MTAAEALSRVKYKFHIPQANTTFDADINKAVEIAVESLAPYAHKPQAPDTSLSLLSTDYSFAWDFTTKDIRLIQYRASATTNPYSTLSGWYHDNANVYITEYLGAAVDLKILPTAPYAYSDIANIPVKFNPAVVDFACSEWAAFLAGSKSAYNIYMQTTGSRGVDSMSNLSDFYDHRAHDRASLVADAEGLL